MINIFFQERRVFGGKKRVAVAIISICVLLTAQKCNAQTTQDRLTKSQPKFQSESSKQRLHRVLTRFRKMDARSRRMPRGILVIGSKPVRGWDVQKSFPNSPAMNRGYDGCRMEDLPGFADYIASNYKPALVVCRAGELDLKDGRSKKAVLQSCRTFLSKISNRLPNTHVLFLPLRCSGPLRKTAEEMNTEIKNFVTDKYNGHYVCLQERAFDTSHSSSTVSQDKWDATANANRFETWTAVTKRYLHDVHRGLRIASPSLVRQGEAGNATIEVSVLRPGNKWRIRYRIEAGEPWSELLQQTGRNTWQALLPENLTYGSYEFQIQAIPETGDTIHATHFLKVTEE